MCCKLAAFVREPLVHFLVIGAALFVFWYAVGDRVSPQPSRIVISPAHVERLAEVFAKTRLRPPSAEELAGLVEQEIEEEVLYREALTMGLDRDDLIIRRRLCLKMDFLADDLSAAEGPTDEQLRAFLRQHAGKFGREPLTSFAQVFVNRAQRGTAAAAEAERLLMLLTGKAPPDWHKLGDPLPLPQEYEAASEAEVARTLGRTFAKGLSGLPAGRWAGPVESGYGLHLVLIRARTVGRPPALDEVRDAVVQEWRAARRQEMKEDLRRRLRAKYAVTVQWPDWAREAAAVTGRAESPKGQGGPS
jgi:hypothetical protein